MNESCLTYELGVFSSVSNISTSAPAIRGGITRVIESCLTYEGVMSEVRGFSSVSDISVLPHLRSGEGSA